LGAGKTVSKVRAVVTLKYQERLMQKLEKIAVLDNEVQAELVDSVLSERGIPHLLQSYHDSALDGFYQAGSGWGHIEATRDSRDEILAVIEELKRQASSAVAPQEPPANGQ
jgi:hypothetical protein